MKAILVRLKTLRAELTDKLTKDHWGGSLTMSYKDGIAKRTGHIGEKEADAFLTTNGFETSVPPGKDVGIDRLVRRPDGDRTARVQVKGRSQISNPRWFQFTVTASSIRNTWDRRESLETLWRQRIFMCDFWLLVSVPMGEVWVFPSNVILNIVEDIAHHYVGRADNQYEQPHYDKNGKIQKKQKELNLDVCDKSNVLIREKYSASLVSG